MFSLRAIIVKITKKMPINQNDPRRPEKLVHYKEPAEENNTMYDLLQLVAMVVSFNSIMFRVRNLFFLKEAQALIDLSVAKQS